MPDLDITSHIKAIEVLKCALLSDVSSLFNYLRVFSREDERDETMAQMLVHLYLLAKRLGLTYSQLDALAVSLLRNEILEEGATMEKQALLKHINP